MYVCSRICVMLTKLTGLCKKTFPLTPHAGNDPFALWHGRINVSTYCPCIIINITWTMTGLMVARGVWIPSDEDLSQDTINSVFMFWEIVLPWIRHIGWFHIYSHSVRDLCKVWFAMHVSYDNSFCFPYNALLHIMERSTWYKILLICRFIVGQMVLMSTSECTGNVLRVFRQFVIVLDVSMT